MHNPVKQKKERKSYSLQNILVFEILFRALGLILVSRIVSEGINFSLRITGQSYLTLQNWDKVLLHPITIPIVLLVLILCVLIFCFEVSVIMTGFWATMGKKRLNLLGLLYFGVCQFLRGMRPSRFVISLLSAIVLLCVNQFPLMQYLEMSKPVGTVLRKLMKNDAIYIGGIVLVILLFVIAVILCFSLCFSYFMKHTTKQSIREAKSFVWKYKFRFFSKLLIRNAILVICYYVLLTLLKIIATVIIVLIARRRVEMALVLVVSGYINRAMIYALSVGMTVMNLGLLTGFFYQYHDEGKQHMPEFQYQGTRTWRKSVVVTIIIALVVGLSLEIYQVVEHSGLATAQSVLGPQITSHRGSSVDAPENTLPAIQAAVDNMADFVEFDLRETKDGEIVVLHDASLRRTTGYKRNVWTVEYAELEKLDAGSWFSDTYRDVRVPTFEQVLEVCKDRIHMNIELKYCKDYSVDLVEKTLELLDEYDMTDQCVITTDYHPYLEQIKESGSSIPTGLIVSLAYGEFKKDKVVDFYSANSAFLTEYNVKQAHTNGKAIHAWTVNTRQEMNRMQRLGVDNIITDQPAFTREVLYGKENTQSIIDYVKMVIKD